MYCVQLTPLVIENILLCVCVCGDSGRQRSEQCGCLSNGCPAGGRFGSADLRVDPLQRSADGTWLTSRRLPDRHRPGFRDGTFMFQFLLQ